MRNDAIRKDGSNESGNEQATEQEPVLSEREQMLQQIDEQLENAPKPLVIQPETDDQGKNGTQDQQLSADADTGSDAEKDKPLMVKVKVDGVEREMPITEVVKGYQKDAAASKRLQEAAEKEREIQRQRAELEQLRAQMQSGQKETQLSDNMPDDADLDGQIEEAMTAIAIGDDEKATELMKVLIKGRSKATATQQVNIDEIKQSIKQEFEQERVASEQAQAFQSFLAEYPEFAVEDSPERKYGDYLFNTQYGAQIEAGEISYQEALNAAAAEARRIYAGTGGTTESTSANRPSKQERKQAIDNVPVAGGRAIKAAQTPETVDDAIKEMRKMRGQIV